MTGSSSTPSEGEAEGSSGAPVTIRAGGPVSGRLTVPPSKSLTHRYLNLALLARRPLVVERPLLAQDTRLFLTALGTCGFTVDERPGEVRLTPPSAELFGVPRSQDRERVAASPSSREGGTGIEGIRGRSDRRLEEERREGDRTNPSDGTEGPPLSIYAGNCGTMLRFLVATLSALPGRYRLDGSPRLRERPVGPLVAALRRLGARIEEIGRPGFVPLAIEGGTLGSGTTALDAGESSQYLSALLMAALVAPGPVTVEVAALTSGPYVDVTLAAAAELGGRIVALEGGRGYRVEPSALSLPRVRVEGDYSAACYPAAAAALAGGEVRLSGLRPASAQGDRGFLALLETMGAETAWSDGELVVRGTGELRAIDADLSTMPDQVPTLAALAPFARGLTRIGNVAHLRIKESDRLAAMGGELRRLGVPVTETADGLEIEGVWSDRVPPSDPVLVDSHGDHRIAMSLALVGLRRPGVAVGAPSVVGKSYPGFWRDLRELRGE